MSARVTLKPCPSGCTTAAVVTGGDGPWHISHVECGCGWRGQEFIAPTAREADEMAATSWNTREQATAELVEALREAVAVADKGVKDCPVNNPALSTGSRNACTKCGHGPDQNCPSLDGANYRAVQIIRNALSRHTEPTEAELLDQVCRSADEALKPLGEVGRG